MALPCPVHSLTPNLLSIPVNFMCGFWLLSWRELIQPITRKTAGAIPGSRSLYHSRQWLYLGGDDCLLPVTPPAHTTAPT